mgnify:CR=1 FL=1
MSLARNLSKFKPSSSGLVETADIADDAVSTAKVNADAIGSDEIANDISITTSGAITTTGAFTSVGIDDNADATSITIDANEDVDINNGSLSVSGDATSLTISKTILDRSGNTSRLISGRAGGNYSDLEIHIAGVGGVNKQLTMDYLGNTTLHNGNLVIGTSGKGIDFSAETGDGPSVTSELLDSYEEGHIGTITMNSSGSNTIDSAYSSKYYIKVGRVVHCYFHIVLNGTLSAGSHALEGLPFTSSNSNPAHRGAGVANAQDASSSYGQDGNYVSITTSENVTSATLYNPVQYVANDRLNVYFSYVTAS